MSTLRQELVIAIRADVRSAKTAMDSLKKSTSDVQRVAKQVQSSFTAMGRVLGGTGITGAASTVARRAIASARSIASGVASSGRAVRTAGTGIVGVFSRVGSAMTTMGRTAKSVFNTVTSPIRATGKMATSALGLLGLGGGVVLAKTAAKDAMDFERILARAWTLRGGPKSYFLELKEEITKMSVETSKPLEDLAQGLYDIFSGLPGIADKDALSMLKQMSALSTVGGDSIGSVVKLGVAALNVYGNALGNTTDRAKQLGYALDNTFMAVKYGVTTVDEMVSAVGPILGLAKLAGVPFKEVTETMAVLTRAGIPTDVAATSLGQIFTSILKPKQAALKQADEIGVDIRPSRIRKYGLMPWLMDAFGRAETAKDPERVLGTLFGNVRALRGIASIQGMGGVVKEVQQGFKEAPGSVLSAQSLIKSTSTFSMDTMLQRLKVALADFGTGIIHGLSGGKDGVMGLFSKYASSEAMFTLGRQLVEAGRTIYEAIMVIPKFFTWVIKDFRGVVEYFLLGLKWTMMKAFAALLESLPVFGLDSSAKKLYAGVEEEMSLVKEARREALNKKPLEVTEGQRSELKSRLSMDPNKITGFFDNQWNQKADLLNSVMQSDPKFSKVFSSHIEDLNKQLGVEWDNDSVGLPSYFWKSPTGKTFLKDENSINALNKRFSAIVDSMSNAEVANMLSTNYMRNYEIASKLEKKGISRLYIDVDAAEAFQDFERQLGKVSESFNGIFNVPTGSESSVQKAIEAKNVDPAKKMRADVFDLINGMYLPGLSKIGRSGSGSNVFSLLDRIPLVGDTVTGYLKKSVFGGPEGDFSKVRTKIPSPDLKAINQQRQAFTENVALQYLMNSGMTMEQATALIEKGVFLLEKILQENQKNTSATVDTNVTLKNKAFRLPDVEKTTTEVGNAQTKVKKTKKGN